MSIYLGKCIYAIKHTIYMSIYMSVVSEWNPFTHKVGRQSHPSSIKAPIVALQKHSFKNQ